MGGCAVEMKNVDRGYLSTVNHSVQWGLKALAVVLQQSMIFLHFHFFHYSGFPSLLQAPREEGGIPSLAGVPEHRSAVTE